MRLNKSNKDEFDDLREKLRDALLPIEHPELRRDLWPRMARRLEDDALRGPRPLQVPWFDWALLALSGAALAFFPALIPALVYHF